MEGGNSMPVVDADISFLTGTQKEYDDLENKDLNAVYFIKDSKRIYAGKDRYDTGSMTSTDRNTTTNVATLMEDGLKTYPTTLASATKLSDGTDLQTKVDALDKASNLNLALNDVGQLCVEVDDTEDTTPADTTSDSSSDTSSDSGSTETSETPTV